MATETAEMQAKPVAWLSRGVFGNVDGHLEICEGPNDYVNLEYWSKPFPVVLQSDFDAMRAQRDEAVRLLRQISLALESLTPSGSEYISHSKLLDTYYADADACVRFVKDQKADGHKARIEAVDERRRTATLQAQITRLREALKPFAAVAEDLDRPFSSGRSRVYLKGSYEPQRGWVVMEQLRTARAALSEPSPSNRGDTP